MEYSYDQVSPFLVEAEVNGSQMHCTFRTAAGDLVQSIAPIRRINSMQNQITRRVKSVVINRTRSRAASMVRSILGGGILGSTASTVIRGLSDPRSYGIQFSDEEREGAIVDAFIKVQAYFPQTEPQIVKRSAPPPPPSPKAEQLSPFEQQLRKAPLQNHFEKEILARILVEMADVDGDIEAEEREMLEDVITPDLGTIPSLMQKDPVSPMECREISAGSKETIYMAAWMMALANMDISPAEENLLQEYADMFALPSQVATRIVRDARFSALENAIDDPSISRAALFELADQLNMNHEDAELCLIQIKKNM